jgi:hypothetical protein
MMANERPVFGTAVPQHRYRIGAYEAVLLGEVDSHDRRRYRFVLAVLDPVQQQPGLYVTAEAEDPQRERGPQALCLYADGGREVIDVSKDWLLAEPFARRALELACERLGIEAAVQQIM